MELAEEVVQSAYITLRTSGPETINLAYIVATVESLAKKAIRYVNRFVRNTTLSRLPSSSMGPDKSVEATELNNLLLDAVAALPKARRTVISYAIAGLSIDDIAARLDTTTPYVRLRLQYAILDIQQSLKGAL
jgi:RNA polymerase sigma factor (sigma-70 family)